MALQTGGFQVARGGGAAFTPAAPAPLQFVDGRTLAPDFSYGGDIGISAVTEGSQAATAALLSGVSVGLEGILSGISTLEERRYAEKQAELEHQRALELAEEKNYLADSLSPLEQERLLGQRLQNIQTRRELSEPTDPYAPYLGESPGRVPRSEENLPEIPDPNLGLVPDDLPLEPLPELLPESVDVEAPKPLAEAALPAASESAPADTTQPMFAGPNGMLLVVPLPGGGRMIINRATGTSTLDKDGMRTAADPAELPEEIKDQLQLKGVTINAKGEVSTQYEPSMAASDREKEIGMMQQSMEQARRVVRDIDTIVKTAESSALPATGKFSDLVAKLPVTTGASDIRALIENITADVAFKTLADMRRNSKTGGALGAISEKELTLLAAAEGSINPSLSWPIFKRNLMEISTARKELMNMWAGKLSSMGAGTSSSDLTSEINALAEKLDAMDDKNSAEYREGREKLKGLVRRQQGK